VALATDEEGLHVLVGQLLGALEDVGGRALGACRLLAAYPKAAKVDLADHVGRLLSVREAGGGKRCVRGGAGSG
jgi:hypothetical protein